MRCPPVEHMTQNECTCMLSMSQISSLTSWLFWRGWGSLRGHLLVRPSLTPEERWVADQGWQNQLHTSHNRQEGKLANHSVVQYTIDGRIPHHHLYPPNPFLLWSVVAYLWSNNITVKSAAKDYWRGSKKFSPIPPSPSSLKQEWSCTRTCGK